MNASLYQAAAGLKATSRWQEVIAENMSSSFIPGFKRQTMSFGAVQAGLMSSRPGVVQGNNRHFVQTYGTVGTDFQPGEMVPSSGASDVAIDGRGFFQLKLNDGRVGYTRDGEFHVNGQGRLVTKQGYEVQGSSGTVQLDAGSAQPVTITQKGEVSQGPNARGDLKVVDFPNYRQLRCVGGGLYMPTDPSIEPVPVPKVSVMQGFLETANTSTIREMGDLVSSSRLFEANQKVIQAQDDRLGRMITDLGNPT